MDDTMTVKMLDSGEHLAHDVRRMSLREPLCCDNPVEQFTAIAILHDNMNISMVDVALVELDDVGVIDGTENCKLFLQQSDVFCNIFSQD